MFYAITGLPGAGKTLNTIDLILTDDVFDNREIYYSHIPCLMFDYAVCQSFQGWFYGHYYFSRKDNTALVRKITQIHKKEDRLCELEDFPYLQDEFENFNPLELFLFWVRRCYPKSKQKKLDELLEVTGKTEGELEFSDIEPLNFHWRKLAHPKDWLTTPRTSVIVSDEIHLYFPNRSASKEVPEAVERLSTHRHEGKDIVWISQDFANVDIFARKMVNRHIHFEFLGQNRINRFSDRKLIDVHTQMKRDKADRKIIPRASHLYDSYYSTDLDTNDNKLSAKLRNALIQVAVLSVLALASVGGFAYMMSDFIFHEEETETEQVEVTESSPEIQDNNPSLVTPPTERLMPWTNPKYNAKVRSYPDVMCYSFGETCKCVTQQATAYEMEQNVCQVLARNGIFDPHQIDPRQDLSKDKKRSGFL
ncbi:hypothetical protein CS022_04555 [Veronia nyctiphanis]|uniref:Zona occludens toxin N-terminal domain-containing protein n=1 Tax=Veronia nyctiphanis TaxID=1278244 RepID=A0A4Q0YT16_9GAMM|nr:zonular occludens toxin domain-containing protein [Veronia nyctiphanis]RXJ74326.1 hypothetical protein CS022_04555 [Veronia nyctiphanis]